MLILLNKELIKQRPFYYVGMKHLIHLLLGFFFCERRSDVRKCFTPLLSHFQETILY